MSNTESQPAPLLSKHRSYQYRPRLVLAIMLLAAIPGSWFVVRLERAWRQEKEVLAIRKIEGCEVAYDGEDVFNPQFFDKLPPLPPITWTESLFGKDFVHRAGTVGLPATRVDEVAPHLERLPFLRRVVVLKTNDSPVEQVDAAAKKIEQDVPGVETVLLAFDFNIRDKTAARERD